MTPGDGEEEARARPSRVLALYIVLAVVTVVVTALVLVEGEDRQAQPSIAGGYDVEGENPCMGKVPPKAGGPELPSTAPKQQTPAGPSFDVKQSGKFVNFTNPQGTLDGKLELDSVDERHAARPLHGDVECVDGRQRELPGEGHPGSEGADQGNARRPADESRS